MLLIVGADGRVELVDPPAGYEQVAGRGAYRALITRGWRVVRTEHFGTGPTLILFEREE
jgi:hypothetical protein